ncbi:molybdopterin-dependent oxidoreductase [Natronorubrum sp. JWXQ-INN-674]|uniref:Molybdopterin-dependent oxidoreductase n=1 Tax=Natronorubrum halalkaliphilum TaxID=2691917 RepID=A0A6B0VK22_9EURY|nr:molybdopterin-dependent oxidoreductase [Natronorubrum halalkaliphilum]MXV61900.1 molybdopterin-dependent oxidoreductase [Natronorubrum halalkaliphilum]
MVDTDPDRESGPSRRTVLQAGAVAATAGLAGCPALEDDEPDDDDERPMNVFSEYPDRDWEEFYRDIWDVDDTFMLTCTPNDTHNCYLEAQVTNGTITRLQPSMGYGEATDLQGNQASHRWDPRVCQKGLAMIERFYGDRRVHAPMVREGFLEWAEDGFPRDDDGSMPEEYAQRGEDGWEEVSFEEAYDLAAETMLEIADHYSGDEGQEMLLEQGYDERVVEETQGAGVRTMKVRGGMPLLGMIRLQGMYRVANQFALVDNYVRDVDEDDALGAVGLDNYSWHTDLPPGHPMVTGQQTVDFDLANVEYADNIVIMGMNWICTKMADSHWLTEARMKGAKVTGVFTDYNATATKCDELVTVRNGTDGALLLGVARQLLEEDMYDEEFVRSYTDLPLLVRMDEGRLLRASDLDEDYEPAELEKTVVTDDDDDEEVADDRLEDGELDVWENILSEDLRTEWGDFVVRDEDAEEFVPVTRDEIGDDFDVPASLEGTFEVETVEGDTVEVRTVFDLLAEYLESTWDADSVAEVTGASPDAVESLAEDIGTSHESTLLLTGMGPNHYNNQDLFGRASFLVTSLTKNVGRFAGNVGSYSGNYRGAYFNGRDQWSGEDPFDIELDPDEPATTNVRYDMQSAHWYSHGDRPLKFDDDGEYDPEDGEYYMGDSHMFTPTKFMWTSGSNSILGNAKGAYDIIQNMLRNGRIEAYFTNEWWWTKTCEYSDIVFPADSWAEHHLHDITASVTNPFVMTMPTTGLDERIYNTRNDAQIYAGVAEALAERTDDERFTDYWEFIDEDEYRARPYLQRVIDHSNPVAGYDIDDMLEEAEEGVPKLIMTGTYPKFMGSRQTQEDDPWYTKTGRMEFFREEEPFAEAGESLPVFREIVDGTPNEPHVLVDGGDHPLIDPETPEDRGWDPDQRDGDLRQVRNVVLSPDELGETSHPLTDRDEGFRYNYMTPKYRHGAHTFANALPNIAVWWGNYGDFDREDERRPYIGEAYLEMNPEDARAEGLEDGDYVWVDADPEDRPYRGWDEDDDDQYQVTRAMLRVRYQPALPPGIVKSWMNLNAASHETVAAHEAGLEDDEGDGEARNEETDYVSYYRYGSHQSATRTWFRRTLLTDTMARKEYAGQDIDVGFRDDVHCANGAPKEAFVRVEHAEDGGLLDEDDDERERLWRVAEMGLRPGYEDDAMEQYLDGEFIETGGD